MPNADDLYAETRDIFTKISEKEGADERAAPLALIELEMRRRKEGLEIGMFSHLCSGSHAHHYML